MDQPEPVTEEMLAAVEEERKRAGEALDILFNAAERGQNVKLGTLRTRSLAGFIAAVMNQNTAMAQQLEQMTEALEEAGKKKKKLWRPRT